MTEIQKQKFDYLFRVFDKNENGFLTEEDLVALFSGLNMYDEEVKSAAKAARRWSLLLSLFADDNKDKKISPEEWREWLHDMAAEAAEQSGGSRTFQRWADATFAAFSNNDNEVTSGDYARWFDAFGLSGDADESFGKIDVNGSGIISREEFAQRLGEFVSADNMTAAGNYLWGNPFINVSANARPAYSEG